MIMLRERAYAKVNLHLQVEGKREDDYHLLKTIFAKVSLHDDVFVEAVREPVVELVVNGPYPVPQGPSNIAYKAAKWYLSRYGIKNWGVKIVIEKRIPPASGLGGGSSDAAAVIRALLRFFGEKDPELVRDSSEIGADVPFFVSGASVALAGGIGEKLQPVDVGKGTGLWLAFSSIHISAKEAYDLLDEIYREVLEKYPLVGGDELLKAVKAWDVDAFGKLFFNHLEMPIFRRYPELEKIKRAFLETGSPFTLMSGSGSTVFAFRPQDCEPPAGLEVAEVEIV